MSLSKASMSDRDLAPRLFAHAYDKKQDAAPGCLLTMVFGRRQRLRKEFGIESNICIFVRLHCLQ